RGRGDGPHGNRRQLQGDRAPPGEYKVRYRLTGYDIVTKYITIDQSPNSISGFDVTLYSH
ncbi:hypothetical protein, partial [Sedimentibacter sp. B4]|uniref:hypothetical protein n=1 Tax=Sedimentibacter sp. B4 TaxID=304766 RepID=UPI0018DB4305